MCAKKDEGIRIERHYPSCGDEPINLEQAKELLGVRPSKKGDVTHLSITIGSIKTPVTFSNSKANRPFGIGLSKRYALEILRGKWSENGETIVIDSKGQLVSGQHRLAGLLLAEEMRMRDTKHWADYGITEPVTMPAILVHGVLHDDTNDTGKARSSGDVLFRGHFFSKEYTDKQLRFLAKDLATAVRLVWLRQGGKSVSDAPHFPHSELVDFNKKHPKLREAVEEIFKLDTAEDAAFPISSNLSRAYAAACLYLAATSKTEDAEADGNDCDFSLWKKALAFWEKFAAKTGLEKGSPVLTLIDACKRRDTGSGSGRDALLVMIVKAMLAWLGGETLDAKGIKPKMHKNDNGKFVLAEYPRFGGIDVDPSEDFDDGEEGEEEAKPAKARKPASKKAAKEEVPTQVENKYGVYSVGDTVCWVGEEGLYTLTEITNAKSVTTKSEDTGDEYETPVTKLRPAPEEEEGEEGAE